MPPTAAIHVNTTVIPATKMVGCGTYSFHAVDSLLGTGRADEHIVWWEVTSYPAGFEFTTLDPRFTELAGQPYSSTRNARDGDWYWWSFSLPMTHEGDYTVRVSVMDLDGNVSTAETTVTVSAFTGSTLYLDQDAVGAGDGTSWADAYTTFDQATAAISGSGGNTILYVRSGQTFTPANRTDFRDDVNIGIYADDPDVGFTLDKAVNDGFRMRGTHNMTVSGMIVVNSAAADSSYGLDALGSGFQDLYMHKCRSGGANRLQSWIGLTATTETRLLMHDCENRVGANGYACAFIDAQLDIFGGWFENNTDSDEAVLRINDGASGVGKSTLNCVTLIARLKSCIRYQGGQHHTMTNCKLSGLTAGTWVSVWMGDAVFDPGQIRIARCNFYANGVDVDPMVKIGDNGWSAVRSNATITFVGNVMDIAALNGVNRIFDFDNTLANNCYSASLVGNTIRCSSAQTSAWLQIPTEADLEILGNIFIYDGPAASITIMEITTGTGTMNVDANDFSLGNATNLDVYSYDGVAYALAAFNALAGIGDNSETLVTLDDDYKATGENTFNAPGVYPFDYYGNELTGVINRGAVNHLPGGADQNIFVDESPDDGDINLGNLALESVQTVDLTIRNNAPVPAIELTLGTIAVSAGGTLTTDPSDSVIEAGSSVTATITIDTATAGARAIVVQIPSDDPDNAVFTVNINATIVGADLAVTVADDPYASGGEIELEGLIEGEGYVLTLDIANSGMSDLTLGTVMVGGRLMIAAGGDPSGEVLAPAESTSVEIEVDTDAVGPVSGSVSVPSDDPDSPWVVTVTGNVAASSNPSDDYTGPQTRQEYLSVAEFEAILAEFLISAHILRQAVATLSTEDKIACIANASIDFDAVRWDGFKLDPDQPTAWPRKDRYGKLILPGGEVQYPSSLGGGEWSFLSLPREIRLGVAIQAAARAADQLEIDQSLKVTGLAAQGITGISGAGTSWATEGMIARQPSSRLHETVRRLVDRYLARGAEMV
ncbi:MAG: hypothetical protein JJ916_10390 [Phycisphaerales bacterium]|nr:hypothetical protein [Phycisphaerales bacterium]